MLETTLRRDLVNADGRSFRCVWSANSTCAKTWARSSFADWARLITPQAWMLEATLWTALKGDDRYASPGEAVASRNEPPAGGAVRTVI
jgi:hypothetical protein